MINELLRGLILSSEKMWTTHVSPNASEVCAFRTAETLEVWRVIALGVGTILFGRLLLEMKDFDETASLPPAVKKVD